MEKDKSNNQSKKESKLDEKAVKIDLGEKSIYKSNFDETSKRLSIDSESQYFDDSISYSSQSRPSKAVNTATKVQDNSSSSMKTPGVITANIDYSSMSRSPMRES
mmetsp:Transcript_19567/g.21873  ORF Transcript_19567/g.21873 Transcript_19567/m.21873 type:complete len:105 (-) Transcript_19567:60-374(-)